MNLQATHSKSSARCRGQAAVWAVIVFLSAPVLLRAQGTSSYPFMQYARFEYVERIAENVPLGGNADNHAAAIDVGSRSKPTFVDIDHDGDMDLVVGSDSGRITLYRNTGSPTNAIFTFSSLLSGLDIGNEAAPAFGNLDGDGDMDLLIGCDDYRVFVYENTGTISNASFALRTGASDPFNAYIGDANYWGNYTCPTITDVTRDGQMDVVVGSQSGVIHFFQNASVGTNLVLTPLLGETNPFKDISWGTHLVPFAVDRNGNGSPEGFLFGTFANDFPHVCSRSAGETYYREPVTDQWGSYPVYALEDGEQDCAPAMADLDGDGRLELVLGGTTGRLFLFKPFGGDYASWQELNFKLPAEADLADMAADPDGDHIKNLLEYALGLPPKSTDIFQLPPPQLDLAGHLTQAIQIREEDPKLKVVAEVSPDLGFSSVTILQAAVADPDPDDGRKTLTFTDPTPSASASQRFMRLRFEYGP